MKLPLAPLREKDPTAERPMAEGRISATKGINEWRDETGGKQAQRLLLAFCSQGNFLAGWSPRMSCQRGRNTVNK